MTNDSPSTDSTAITQSDLTLGSIAESRNQMDYVVEVYGDRDRENPPEKRDYEFGTPVYSRSTVRGEKYAMIGVVYDSKLVDPDQGREGPRLSNPDQELFVPGYVDEKRTLLGVAFLGYARLESLGDTDGYTLSDVSQGMPRWTLDIDDEVHRLSTEGFRQFHVTDGRLRVRYYDRLLETAGTFGAEVTLELVERLREATTVDGDLLDVIEQKVRWETHSDRGVIR